jgi:hypothetical protein
MHTYQHTYVDHARAVGINVRIQNTSFDYMHAYEGSLYARVSTHIRWTRSGTLRSTCASKTRRLWTLASTRTCARCNWSSRNSESSKAKKVTRGMCNSGTPERSDDSRDAFLKAGEKKVPCSIKMEPAKKNGASMKKKNLRRGRATCDQHVQAWSGATNQGGCRMMCVMEGGRIMRAVLCRGIGRERVVSKRLHDMGCMCMKLFLNITSLYTCLGKHLSSFCKCILWRSRTQRYNFVLWSNGKPNLFIIYERACVYVHARIHVWQRVH